MRFVFGEDDPEELLLNPGDVVVIPPNVPHKATCIGEVEEIDMWAPRRDDWLNGTDDYLRESSQKNTIILDSMLSLGGQSMGAR